MASIIKSRKKNGTVYVYESESYWDKEKKQPRSRRKLIGRLDEETGEIIPTGKPGSSVKNLVSVPEDGNSTDYRKLCDRQAAELIKKEDEILSLRKQVTSLSLSCNEYRRRLQKINELSGE